MSITAAPTRRRPSKRALGKPIRVALPLGIGDAHWSCQKLRALKQHHDGAPLHAHINESENHRTVGYLGMMPFVDKAVMDARAPFSIMHELKGTYRDERYQYLDGCRGWRGFDYVLIGNHCMESGRHISEWLPELATDYSFEYAYTDEERERTVRLMPEPTVLLYLSGVGPNLGFHQGWWTVEHWRQVVALLNEAGIEPLIVGANTPDDLGYLKLFESANGGRIAYRSVVGETSIPDYVLLIERASAWCGLNSGGGIVSASAGTPTVMLWADSRWPVGHAHFRPEMQTAWLARNQLRTYRAFPYGCPVTTPANIARTIVQVAR